MSESNPSYAKVEVAGVTMRDAFQGPNYSFLTVRVGDNQYFDWACNDDGPLDAFRGVRGGTLVRISGRLGKRKIKNSDPNAPARYEIQLNAERISFAPGRQPAPPPPQPQEGWTQGRNTDHREQRAYQPQGSKTAYQPQQAAQKQHPAQHDADDFFWGDPQ